jgi:hypothetical protein
VSSSALIRGPFGLLVLVLALLGAAPPAAAQWFGFGSAAPSTERLQVTEPFIELRTGPGRGYPVFFVAEKGAWITVELRRTDWYRVRAVAPQGSAPEGRVGWVHRNQLASTLTEAGQGKTFRDVLLDDFLRRRAEFGTGWGRFGGEPALKFWGAYRLGETLAAEVAFGQVQGAFSGTSYWHVGLVSEPWADQRWSPFFTVGLGKFNNIPNTSLVSALPTNANLGHAGIGLRWHIAERFVARLDWSLYAAFVSDARSLEYRAVTLGIGFFF